MRIVVYAASAIRGGALSILQDFHSYLTANPSDDHWVFIVGSSTLLQGNKNIEIVNSNLINTWFKRLMFDFIWGKEYINKLKPDVIFSLTNTAIFGTKIPQVIYVHQGLPFQNIKKYSFFDRKNFKLAIYQHLIGKIIYISIKRARNIIVQSKWMKNEIEKRMGQASSKIMWIKPEIKPIPRIVIREEFLNNCFIYPTSNLDYKNNNCLYKACELLNQRNCQYKVLLTVNSGPLIPNIEFIGHITREELFMHLATKTLVFPSYVESFGLPLEEAKATGTVVLAAEMPYAKEVLEGYLNAYYFDPDNPATLAELMIRVMNNVITREKISNDDAINCKSWGKVIEVIQDIKAPITG